MIVKINPKDVQRLREQTGAGVMDCKRALEEAKNDLEKAKAILREQGLDKAKEKSGRAATQGVVDAYGHVSVRISSDRFLLSRARAPECIEPADIMEFDFNGSAIDAQDRQPLLLQPPVR